MKISLDLIKDSPRPVRTSWDEDKMNELAQSIHEQGVIVPVKVRPVEGVPECGWHGLEYLSSSGVATAEGSEWEPCSECLKCQERVWPSYVDEDGFDVDSWDIRDMGIKPPAIIPFELVYGHRRVEAARRAGLDEIPAIVEGVDDTDALIQALIENVQREDMTAMDKARALKVLMDETGWSQMDIDRHGLMSHDLVSLLMPLLDESPQVQQMVDHFDQVEDEEAPITYHHVAQVRRVLRDDANGKEEVLKKAQREQLNRKQTRRVAEAVRDAPDEETKQALIDTPVERDTDIWEGAARIAVQDKKREKKERREMAPEVKELLEDIKRGRRILERGKDSVRMGKMGPEHAPYIANQLRKYAEWLNEWADELDRFREEMVNG